jgi:hypothetical protein
MRAPLATLPASNSSRWSASPGLPGLIWAPLATAPAFEGLAAERATGIGPGAAARHVEGRGTSPASSASRVAVERLAGLPGLARPRMIRVRAGGDRGGCLAGSID